MEADLGTMSAVVNVLSALGVLWIMQAVTQNAGMASGLALLKLFHRASLAILSIALVTNAGATLYHDTEPRVIDFIVELALLVVVLFSAARHRLVGPIHAT